MIINYRRRFFKVFFILAFLPVFRVAGAELKGIPKAVDGDSLDMKVRLHGVDAPEYDQDFGPEAAAKLAELLAGQEIVCHRKTYDLYERTVAECFIGELNVNAYMVKNGYAWAYRNYGRDYVKLEEAARKNRLGLWSRDNPVPPWEFRKRKRLLQEAGQK